MGVELVDYDDLDVAEVSRWADSLSASLRSLATFNRKIKERTTMTTTDTATATVTTLPR